MAEKVIVLNKETTVGILCESARVEQQLVTWLEGMRHYPFVIGATSLWNPPENRWAYGVYVIKTEGKELENIRKQLAESMYFELQDADVEGESKAESL